MPTGDCEEKILLGVKQDIVFRVDSSSKLGNGHVVRCLALADVLKECGCECLFVVRDLAGSGYQLIKDKDYQLLLLPSPKGRNKKVYEQGDCSTWSQCDALYDSRDTVENIRAYANPQKYRWGVVDHYSWSNNEHLIFKDVCQNLLVVDDLANRLYHADALIDSGENNYQGKCLDSTRLMLGSKYHLLRREFLEYKNASITRRKTSNKIKKIGVMCGGTDPLGVNLGVLSIVTRSQFFNAFIFSFYLAKNNNGIGSLDLALQKYKNCRIVIDAPSIAQEMTTSDVFITACGGALWEAATLGCPCAIYVAGPDQKNNYMNFMAQEAAYSITGDACEQPVCESKVHALLDACINNKQEITECGINAQALCDGEGAYRVSNYMLSKTDERC